MNHFANIPLIEQVSAELTALLGDDFDPETFWDSLDGETDAGDILDRLIAEMQDSEALAGATKEQVDALSARKSRFEARARAAKSAMLSILNATGQKKAERARATVSRRAGSLSVRITDENDVPRQLCKTTVTPDKAAIKKQLQAGETVPGAELERGPDGVIVRVS